MRGELVAIDLETTGLDPNTDNIIEVGAVRINDGEIVEEFSTLVNPGGNIPQNVTHITGIRTEDVLDAPRINAVLKQITDFVGGAPLVGHNVNFDANFLARHGILKNNLRIDTYDLASVLLPRAPRYNLSSLSALIGIDLESAHRALDDARAAARLYWLLWQKALALPYPTLREIVNAAVGMRWDAFPVFEAALRESARQPGETPDVEAAVLEVFTPEDQENKPLRPNEVIEGMNIALVAGLIEKDGQLAHNLPGYEYRRQQVDMTRTIAEAFNQSQHLLIEAGTGTGKSIAYLVPSIIWSTLNGERVVISTNTINLQEQLIEKDIPALQEALDVPFKAAVLKGRSNYLCPRRLIAIRRRRPTSVDELRTLSKILVWLLESSSGDKGEISFRGPVEHNTWQRLSAEDEGCTLDRCRAIMGGSCPFYKARKSAEASHLIVVNHALLLSDAATDNRVLPDYRYLVLDEAHHLEDAVTNSMSFRLDEATLRRRLADLGGPQKGLLGDLLKLLEGTIPEKELRKMQQFVERISEATGVMEMHISGLFEAIRHFLSDINAGQATEYVSQIRVVPSHRAKASFAQVQATWNVLQQFMEVISEAMRHLTDALSRMEAYDIPSFNDLVNSTSTAGRYLLDVKTQLTAFTTNPDSNMIYWVSIGQDPNYQLSIHAAPLHVGPLVEKYLWQSKDAVIMTSATLRTNGSFEFVRERLNADDVVTAEVGSPFDYQKSTLIYIPNDIPEPNDRQRYQQAVERGLIELAAGLNGRVLGLFTSYSQLRQTAQAITPRLALGNIVVYDQSDGSSRQALLDGFKSTERAVLLGTKSFWEGVDIPGESLSALVIVRLPFAVPSDPVFAARSETYSNSFEEYAVPDAILRFRQGFGRLIRTATDRGIVTIFDRRIISKNYGANFLEALPDCTIQHGTLAKLPEAAQNWLSRKNSP
jgi:ATP-dependent DNA helicase DinG